MLDPDYVSVSVSVTPGDVSKIHDYITRRVHARTGLTFTEYAGASPEARQEVLKLLEPPVEQKCPQCRGTGYVPKCDDGSHNYLSSCDQCKGKGRYTPTPRF